MFTVQYVKTPVYFREDKSVINCIVKFAEYDTEHPYAATSYDNVAHGKQLYLDLIAGVYGEIDDYVPPPELPAPPSPTPGEGQTVI
jgi:hypothetical protein